MSIPNLPKFYLIVDTETLGLDIIKHQICEIGSILVDGKTLELISKFQSYIIPKPDENGIIQYEQQALDTNGLTLEFLAENGISHEEVWPNFVNWVKSYSPSNFDVETISCNKAFDIPRIERCLKAYNVATPFHYANHYDIKDMARYAIPELKRVKLQTICEYFGIPYINAHGALQDAFMTLEAFKFFEDKRRKLYYKVQYVQKEFAAAFP